ncbi:MAG TPA: ribonuclease H-like domain-containing protein, partial [Vicinamibacteria bacterium]
GAGTAAFLIGVGFVEGDRFRVRQYFMRDYHEEPALLLALARDLARFRRIVTFNGKMFDLPLLEARYRLNRQRFPLSAAPHFDLLHPARRLWKARLESCRLQWLEAELIGLRRSADIPGELIPQVYFDWVRRRDARALVKVFRHNRDDIVSLAALSIVACQWVEEHRAEDPRDVLSLARLLERARLFARSETQYRRAASEGRGPLRNAALLGLATRAKRAGDFEEAAGLWAAAAEAGEVLAMHELAVHHEHRTRDLDAALGMVDRALERLLPREEPRERRLAAGFWRRRTRLLAKAERRRLSGSRPPGSPRGPG